MRSQIISLFFGWAVLFSCPVLGRIVGMTITLLRVWIFWSLQPIFMNSQTPLTHTWLLKWLLFPHKLCLKRTNLYSKGFKVPSSFTLPRISPSRSPLGSSTVQIQHYGLLHGCQTANIVHAITSAESTDTHIINMQTLKPYENTNNIITTSWWPA